MKQFPKLTLVPRDESAAQGEAGRNATEFELRSLEQLPPEDRDRLHALVGEIVPQATLVAAAQGIRHWDVRPVIIRAGENEPSVIRFSGPVVSRLAHLSARLRETFERIRATPEIAPSIQDWGIFNGQIWYRRALVEQTLGHVLSEKQPLDERRVFSISRGLVEELYRWHERGIVHGHITSSNIFVDSLGRVALLDAAIGVALVQAGERSADFQLQSYAPELLSGEALVFSSDLFGLGLVLRRMLVMLARRFELDRNREQIESALQPLADLGAKLLESDPSRRPGIAQARRMFTDACTGFEAAKSGTRVNTGNRLKPPASDVATGVQHSSTGASGQSLSVGALAPTDGAGLLTGRKETLPLFEVPLPEPDVPSPSMVPSHGSQGRGVPRDGGQMQGQQPNLGLSAGVASGGVPSHQPEHLLQSHGLHGTGSHVSGLIADSAQASPPQYHPPGVQGAPTGYTAPAPLGSAPGAHPPGSYSAIPTPAQMSTQMPGQMPGQVPGQLQGQMQGQPPGPMLTQSAPAGSYSHFAAPTATFSPQHGFAAAPSGSHVPGAQFGAPQYAAPQYAPPQYGAQFDPPPSYEMPQPHPGAHYQGAPHGVPHGVPQGPPQQFGGSAHGVPQHAPLHPMSHSYTGAHYSAAQHPGAPYPGGPYPSATYPGSPYPSGEYPSGSHRVVRSESTSALGPFLIFLCALGGLGGLWYVRTHDVSWNGFGVSSAREDVARLEEYRENWNSRIPSRMLTVALAAIDHDQPSELAESVIIAASRNGESNVAAVNAGIIRIAFNDQWEQKLSRDDRRVALALGLGGLLKEKLPRDLPSLEQLHPGVILAVAASVNRSIGRSMLGSVPAKALAELPPPYGAAFRELTERAPNLNCGDESVQRLARLATRGVELEELVLFLKDDTSVRLRALGHVFSQDNARATMVLEIILQSDNAPLAEPSIAWAKSFKLMEWSEMEASERLFLLAGVPPAATLTPEHLEKLCAHPSPAIRSYALQRASAVLHLEHPGATDAIKWLSEHPDALSDVQTIQLLRLLTNPAKVDAGMIAQWLESNPPVPFVAGLLLATTTRPTSTELDLSLAVYLKGKGWKPALEELRRLSLHPDKFTRLFAYNEIYLLDDRETAREFLRSVQPKEQDEENINQLRQMLVDLGA